MLNRLEDPRPGRLLRVELCTWPKMMLETRVGVTCHRLEKLFLMNRAMMDAAVMDHMPRATERLPA